MLYTRIAALSYLGVVVLLILWQPGNQATQLSFGTLNLYTIVYVLCYLAGYGSYSSVADLPIPMVADCTDYETFRGGNFVPGIMGTLFSLVDKLVSSLGATIVGAAVLMIGIETLPDTNTPYVDGMKWVVILLFCILPILAWLITQFAMHHYSLTGKRMKEIQAVNAARREAVNNGMTLKEAMKRFQTAEDLPGDR